MVLFGRRNDMYIGGSAVYNYYLGEFMDKRTDQLQSIVDICDKRSIWKRFFGHLNPFIDWDLKLKAITDLICARKNPNGDVAKKINWKLDAYRKKK